MLLICIIADIYTESYAAQSPNASKTNKATKADHDMHMSGTEPRVCLAQLARLSLTLTQTSQRSKRGT